MWKVFVGGYIWEEFIPQNIQYNIHTYIQTHTRTHTHSSGLVRFFWYHFSSVWNNDVSGNFTQMTFWTLFYDRQTPCHTRIIMVLSFQIWFTLCYFVIRRSLKLGSFLLETLESCEHLVSLGRFIFEKYMTIFGLLALIFLFVTIRKFQRIVTQHYFGLHSIGVSTMYPRLQYHRRHSLEYIVLACHVK